MPRSVAIVFEPDYAIHLERLAFHTPVWLVDTPPNRAAAEDVLRSAAEWPHIAVTLFRSPAGQPTREDWRALLSELEIRERSFEALEVIGTPKTNVAHASLVEAGFARFDQTASGGFRARRS
jgi:hypothetical protein